MRTNMSQTGQMVTFLVAGVNSAMPVSGPIVGSGNSMNLSDGQLGVISADHSGSVLPGNFVPAATTATNTAAIKVIQGTPNSASLTSVNPFANNDKAFVESGVIKAGKIKSVTTNAFLLPTYNTIHVRSLSGWEVDTSYKAVFTLEGVRPDIVFGMNREVFSVTVPALSTTPTNSADYVLQTIALEANKQSKLVGDASPLNFTGRKPFVVLGLKSSGGSGTTIGTLTKTTSAFNIAQYTTPTGTVTVTMTPNEELINTLHTAIGNEAGLSTATIEVLGSVTPGSAATINQLLILVLPEDQNLAFDNIKETHDRIDIGISTLTYTKEVVAAPFEGRGSGRQTLLWFRDKAKLQVFNMQNHFRHNEYFIEAPEYVSSSSNYTATIIDYYDDVTNLNNQPFFAKQLVILVPAAVSNPTADADTGYTIASSYSTAVTSWNNTLGAWLSDADSYHGNIEYKGSASKSTPFV